MEDEVNGKEKYADRINRLLAKANDDAVGEEEREAFLAKAQEWMTQYAITEHMLADARGDEVEELTTDDIYFAGMFNELVQNLAFVVMQHNNCEGYYFETRDPESNRKARAVKVCGFASDVERVKLLTTSLRLQLATAMNTWWKNHPDQNYMSGWHKVKERRGFIVGFTAGVSMKLADAQRAGQQAAAEAAEERGVKDASKSVALVVRSRQDTVKDWFDETHGRNLRYARSRQQNGSGSARGAGVTAGRNADTGLPRVGGNQGAIRG